MRTLLLNRKGNLKFYFQIVENGKERLAKIKKEKFERGNDPLSAQ